jgi:hypothetical protein
LSEFYPWIANCEEGIKMQTARKIAIAATVVLTVVVLAWGQSASNEKTLTSGRYQLIAATVQLGSGAPAAEQHMFMLDTMTGKVWNYVPAGGFTTPTGKPALSPEMLVRVFVDELEGTVPDLMQKTVDYYEKHPATRITPRH